jgi:hypothetical protein
MGGNGAGGYAGEHDEGLAGVGAFDGDDDAGMGGGSDEHDRLGGDADALDNLGLSPDEYNAVSNLAHAASSSNGSPAHVRRVSPSAGRRNSLGLRSLADSAMRVQRHLTPAMHAHRSTDHTSASALSAGVATSVGLVGGTSPGGASMMSPIQPQFLASPAQVMAPGSRASNALLSSSRGRTAAGQVSGNPLSSPQGWLLGSALRHDSAMGPAPPGTRMSINPFGAATSIQRPPRAGRAALMELSPLPSSRKSLSFATASRAMAAADTDDKTGHSSPRAPMESQLALNSLLQALEHQSAQKQLRTQSRTDPTTSSSSSSSSSSTASGAADR